MKWCLLLMLPLSAYGQVTLGLSSGSTVKVNSTSSRDVTITSTAPPAAIQFTLNWSANLTNVNVTAGTSAIAASKTVACGTPATQSNGTVSMPCVVAAPATAPNANPIANGSLVKINFTAANSGGLTATVTTALASPLGPLSASATALAIATTGGAGTIPFVVAGDLDGNGQVTSADYAALQTLVLTAGPCSSAADMNDDGKCDILDIQLLTNVLKGP